MKKAKLQVMEHYLVHFFSSNCDSAIDAHMLRKFKDNEVAREIEKNLKSTKFLSS